MAVAEFSQRYGEINQLTITRKINEDAEYGFTDDDFQGRPYVELPGIPSDEQQIAVGIARVYDVAEADVARLCALVLAPKDELKLARVNDQIDAYLDDKAEEIMDDAEPEEVVEILSVALEMSRERFTGKDLAGKLRRAWSPETTSSDSESLRKPGSDTASSGSPTEHPAAGRMPLAGSLEEIPKDGPSGTTGDSSTVSPGPTDGPPSTSSTTSPSETPSATHA